LIVAGLWKFKDPRAVEVAIELLEDEDVVPHALSAVGRLKPKRAIPYLERLLNHPKPAIRKKALQVLEKSTTHDTRNRHVLGRLADASREVKVSSLHHKN
jgi:HEAT repeat protein